MLELTKFGDTASEKGEPECTGKKAGGLGGWSDRHEMELSKKKHMDTHVGNEKNPCYDMTALGADAGDERMALRNQRNRRNVPKMDLQRNLVRDGKLNAWAVRKGWCRKCWLVV